MGGSAGGRRRQEGGEKVTGATRFTADLELAGMVHVQLVLSHAASGQIHGIDTVAARSAPGVVDVITGRDLPELDSAGPDLPLALERVFYGAAPLCRALGALRRPCAAAAFRRHSDDLPDRAGHYLRPAQLSDPFACRPIPVEGHGAGRRRHQPGGPGQRQGTGEERARDEGTAGDAELTPNARGDCSTSRADPWLADLQFAQPPAGDADIPAVPCLEFACAGDVAAAPGHP